MAELPVLKPRQVVSAPAGAGFYVHHQTGSHAILKSADNAALRVTVPMHGKDLKKGTLRSIIRQAGLTVEGVCGSALNVFYTGHSGTLLCLAI